jgi:hypothetical protein
LSAAALQQVRPIIWLHDLVFHKLSSLNSWLCTGLAKIGLSAPAVVELVAESRRLVWNHCGISVDLLWDCELVYELVYLIPHDSTPAGVKASRL